jgi:hypothetical protein
MAATTPTTDTLNDDAAPGGFVRIDHHDIPGYFHAAEGVVITVHERDRLTAARRGYDRPFRVIMAQNQATRYDGAFTSQAAAERKAKELVASYLDARSEP